MPTPLSIPTLHTERLTLRAPALTDFDSSLVMWSDPHVTRFIGGRAQSREEVWGRLLRYIGHWARLGYGFWSVDDRATGTHLGEVGFSDFHRELEPSFGATPEMGWAFGPAAHGRGIATEAVQAAIAWGDQHFKEGLSGCIISPGNVASQRVAMKCGFVEKVRSTYKGEPTIIYERHASATSAK